MILIVEHFLICIHNLTVHITVNTVKLQKSVTSVYFSRYICILSNIFFHLFCCCCTEVLSTSLFTKETVVTRLYCILYIDLHMNSITVQATLSMGSAVIIFHLWIRQANVIWHQLYLSVNKYFVTFSKTILFCHLLLWRIKALK